MELVMKPYKKIMNLIQDNAVNTDKIIKYLSKLPDSHLEYGMDYEILKIENEKLDKDKMNILLTIPEMCCLQGKTKILLYYQERKYDLTQLKERYGTFNYTKNSKEESILFRPGKHNLLSCLMTYDIDQAVILKNNYNIDLFSEPEAIKNAMTCATLFFNKDLFMSLCLEQNNLDYIGFLNKNTDMIIHNISYIFSTFGVYNRKIFDLGFIFHEILDITDILKTSPEKKTENLRAFFKIDKFNKFIFANQLKNKNPEYFEDEACNQIIFDCISNFKEGAKIENYDFEIFLEGCKLINWNKSVEIKNQLKLCTDILEYLIKNNDIKNFAWLLSKTAFFKNTYLIEFLSKKENVNDFLYTCLMNKHLFHNPDIKPSGASIFSNVNNLYRYLTLKESSIIKNNIQEDSNSLPSFKKRL